MILHVVLLRLRPGLARDDLRAFSQALARACREIPAIRHAWAGPRKTIDAGYERHFGDSTYDGAAVFQFDDQDGLISYLRHDLHRELGAMFWRVSQAAVVFEFEGRDLTQTDADDTWFSSPRPEP